MKPVKIKWSHSALKDFEGCARRYHEVKVLKNYPFPDTEQTRYGKQLHEAAELYIKEDKPLPPQFKFMKPVLEIGKFANYIAPPQRGIKGAPINFEYVRTEL